MAAASIAFTDMELRPTRHAGRGGVGAVMGAKGVKVIVLDDAGMKMRTPNDPEKFKAANKAWVAGLRKTPGHRRGAAGLRHQRADQRHQRSRRLPHQQLSCGAVSTGVSQDQRRNPGRDWKSPAAARLATHGCHRGCVIHCSGIFYDKDGNYLTKQPEYETVWAHGGNCGIDDLDAIAQLDRLDDDFGLDTIEMGATIGVAMEAGLAEFGDAEAAINLVKEVGKGTPLGRILGNGAAGHRQGVRRRTGSGGQRPGHAGLRPARRPGHRRDLCHHAPWAPIIPPDMPSPPTS